MLPDKSKIMATKKMQLKHNLWAGASKMNIVPNLHTMLISVPKMAEHGYIAVFDKHEARIYNGTTTKLTASGKPIIVSPRYEDTSLWKMELDLDYKILGRKDLKHFIAGINKANAIFNFPNTRHYLLYYHALVGFPVKETFSGCSMGRKLCHVARPDHNPHRQAFPRLRGNTERAHEGAMERDMVNQGQRII